MQLGKGDDHHLGCPVIPAIDKACFISRGRLYNESEELSELCCGPAVEAYDGTILGEQLNPDVGLGGGDARGLASALILEHEVAGVVPLVALGLDFNL